MSAKISGVVARVLGPGCRIENPAFLLHCTGRTLSLG